MRRRATSLIAPTIPYGACQSLADYPGTIDIDNEVLYLFCKQIFENLYRHGARKFVFLNGHGGNMKMIERLALEYEKKGCLVAMLNWWLMAWDMNPCLEGRPRRRRGDCCHPGHRPLPGGQERDRRRAEVL